MYEVAVAALSCAASIVYIQRHMFDEHNFSHEQQVNIKAHLHDLVCESMAGVALEF